MADEHGDTPTAAKGEQEPVPEWWRDPRMPWSGKPSRADLLCWGGISLSGFVTLALVPLRPVLLTTNPLGLAALTGSRTAVVALGALAAVGRMDLWWLGLILATLSVVKFDPLLWWAGKLWGRGMLEVVAGRSAFAARNAARAERLAGRWAVPAILLTYVVPVLPTAVVYVTAGATGMSLRRFLVVDLIGAFATRCLYMYLGYRIGQPAVDILDTIADYSMWISLGLVVVIVVGAVRQSRVTVREGH